jgi:hypothetical protein
MAPSSPISGKYQLVILGHSGDAQVEECTKRLNAALAIATSNLGLNSKKFLLEIQSGATGIVVNRKMPTVAVFFGMVPSPKLNATDIDRLSQLLADGILIIPIAKEILSAII